MPKITPKRIWLSLFFLFTITHSLLAIQETENNNHFHNADLTYQDSVMTGAHSSPSDTSDYFVTVPRDDGTFKLMVNYTNSGVGSHDLFIYIYNKNGVLIGNRYIYNVDTVQNVDSIFVYCRQQDTIYVRISTAGSFGYSLQYSMITSGTRDIEPNNSFVTSQAVLPNDTIRGRIGYASLSPDGDDYFVTELPIYGTMKYYVWYENTSNSGGSDFFTYIYNKNGNLIGNSYQYNQAVGPGQDSIKIYCREQDTVYLRIASSGCFSYKIYYTVDAPATDDVEPNGSFASAQGVTFGTPIGGRIGYTSVATDQDDYFVAPLPTFGTLKYYVEYDNTSNYSGSDFFTYIYNKNGILIGNSYKYNQPLGISRDTITIYCRELDTIYVRISSAGCFSYTFSYEVFAPTSNDTEPNDAFASANPMLPNDTTGGRIGYQSTGTDGNDYFWTMLPEDGTIKYHVKYYNTSNSSGSDFFTYVYNKNGTLIGNSYKYNQPLGVSEDSINIYCRAKDTVYFRISSAGCFSYQMYYEMDVPTPDDGGSNEDFSSAQLVAFADTTYGRIGYTHTATDNNDYFLTVLPDDGTLRYVVEFNNTSNYTGSDFFTYIYNKNGTLIGNSYKYNMPLGKFVDTVEIPCRAADTAFVRISSSGCFSYKFYKEVIPSGISDQEPNDISAEAAAIDLSNKLEGRIGYGSISPDGNDYFKFYLPQNSTIAANLEYINTSRSTGSDFFVYLYRSSGALAFSDYNYNQPTDTVQELLNMACLPSDTFYLRISSQGCFSYSIDFEIDVEQPLAKIEASQLGQEVGFVARTENADTHLWDFDDGTTSTFQYPKKDFAIGAYNVVLSATNSSCNLVHRDTFFVEVKGIEKYDPNHAGAGGDAALHIYGGGLDTATKVTLSLGGVELSPIEKHGNDKKNMLTAIFDLHFADAGDYDLTIEIPGEPAVTYSKGFRIDDFEYPYTAADIIGPDRWRTNRDTRFILAVSNRGNVTANGVWLNLFYPKSVQLKMEHSSFVPDSTGMIAITTDDTTVTLAASEIKSIYKDVSPVSPIDSFQGAPYDGYMMPIMIPHIPANTTIELPFLANSSQTGNPEFIVYTQKPNFYGSCETPNYAQTYDNAAGEMLDAVDIYADNTKNVPLKTFAVATKIGKEHLALSARQLGDHFWAWYDGYEVAPETYAMRNQELTAANDYLVKTATTEGLKLVAGKGQKYLNGKYSERVDFINKRLANNPKMSAELTDKYLNKLNSLTATNQRLNAMFKNSSDAVTLYEKLIKLQAQADDCPELQKQLDDLINELDKELTPREQKKKKSQTVVSMDPNAIYGPQGVDAGRWINTTDLITYMVTFENVDTATADAQVVTVYDTLNPDVFDLSSFRFGNMFVGSRSLHMPTDRQEFVYDLDLRPGRDIIVRIFGKFDQSTGLITWTFVSLDPATMELPILDGFLPPNVNAPEGEGGMTYSVRMRDDVPTGTEVLNSALIFFDENEPIATNIWSNSIDKGLPNSDMVAFAQNTTVQITFNASDEESGVDVRYLYVQREGETEWLPLVATPYDTLSFHGEMGETYNFYSIAADKLGQKELKNAETEASVTVPFVPTDIKPVFSLYPNPLGDGQLNIKSNGIFPGTKIRMYDVSGKIVREYDVDLIQSSDATLNLGQVRSGVYSIYFATGNGYDVVEKLVITREK